MKCVRCQHESPPAAKFCVECAAPLAAAVTCARCGTRLPPGAKFCPECALPAGAAAPAAETRFASPVEYTPTHIAEKILNSRGALEGERKHVTVLFADLKGSMELLADRDAEDARRLLDAVLERMIEAVHHYEGTVNQVMGDGIIALFGAPIAHEDHAVRACYAALRLQESVTRPAQEARRAHGATAQSPLRLNSGQGVARATGNDPPMDHPAPGETTPAAAGHGQAVAIVGEAGVGKSRLIWEFTRSPRTHGGLVLQSGSVSYGKATPYLPVIELLKGYLSIPERDDHREIRERVAGKLLTLDRTLEPLLTPLLALLDVPVDDAAWGALDPPQRRQRTLEAVKRLLLRESRVQPLLLLFEDLHWTDSESQALLDGLIESLPTARILLVVSYRPEYQHAWGSKTYYTQLRIDPFPPDGAEELLTALLGQDESLETLKRVLIERTQGNPFFLEETVQTLVETRMLVGDRGAYRITKAPEAWQIPATIQAILAARIDRLPPEDKPLLQAASVIGKEAPFTLLQAIADVPEESLRRGLTNLQAAEFLYETSVFPDPEYTFKHALTHEVAYASVLHDRRRALHARIVEAIEAFYPDRLAEQVERLAHHAFRGEVWAKAVTYLRQAGAKALAHSAYREAVSWFEQALAAF